MLVTFISECEKKALKRTRRVLDAFANRIGSNTWQTPITQEGLDAVRKLLRKTASKNTAISCHQLKSRLRTELLWIIGNRDKFNSEGIVAVNYTEKNPFIGEIEDHINMNTMYANTKKQPLDQHLFAVGYVSYLLCQKLVGDDTLAKAVFVAGCWHDMGKIDPAFQKWILDKTKKKLIEEIPEEGQHIDKKFSFEKHPRHNEISLLLYYLFDNRNDTSINKPNKKLVKHTVYWHHAKPVRKEEFKTLEVIYKKLMASLINETINSLSPRIHGLITAINTNSANYNLDLKIGHLLKHADADNLSELRISLTSL